MAATCSGKCILWKLRRGCGKRTRRYGADVLPAQVPGTALRRHPQRFPRRDAACAGTECIERTIGSFVARSDVTHDHSTTGTEAELDSDFELAISIRAKLLLIGCTQSVGATLRLTSEENGRVHTLYSALRALQHEGQARLREQAAAVVAGGPIHADAHVDARIQQLPHLHCGRQPSIAGSVTAIHVSLYAIHDDEENRDANGQQHDVDTRTQLPDEQHDTDRACSTTHANRCRPELPATNGQPSQLSKHVCERVGCQLAHRRNARGEAHVGAGAVRDADATLREEGALVGVEHAAVCEPAVLLVPPDLPAWYRF